MRHGRLSALLPLAPFLLTALVLAGCVSAEPAAVAPPGMRAFYVPEVDESLYGTWINRDYHPPGPSARLIIYPWGLVEAFVDPADIAASGVGTSVIMDRWTDETGQVWYRELRRSSGQDSSPSLAFVLARVSRDEKTLEYVVGTSVWPRPSELGPGLSPTYVTYRRLQ